MITTFLYSEDVTWLQRQLMLYVVLQYYSTTQFYDKSFSFFLFLSQERRLKKINELSTQSRHTRPDVVCNNNVLTESPQEKGIIYSSNPDSYYHLDCVVCIFLRKFRWVFHHSMYFHHLKKFNQKLKLWIPDFVK